VTSCRTCGGLVAQPGIAYGYAGRFCDCWSRPIGITPLGQRCGRCGEAYINAHVCPRPPWQLRPDQGPAESPIAKFAAELRAQARPQLLEAAYKAACAFIDAHVGDPDMTPEMVRAHAEFVRLRKEVEKP
jgi:hypothetical protein